MGDGVKSKVYGASTVGHPADSYLHSSRSVTVA